eukprot:COSAG03_NODE_6914_length_987_cov_1.261261_1_plen_91_part_00
MWDALRELLPEIVFIPEQSDYSLDYATTTPLQDDWGGSPIGVNPMIKAVWPQRERERERDLNDSGFVQRLVVGKVERLLVPGVARRAWIE